MKTIQFKIQYRSIIRDTLHATRTLRTIKVKEYDEFTYYTSQRMNPEVNFGALSYYLYDKYTGIFVVRASSKEKLFRLYNSITKRYRIFRESGRYQEEIEFYEQLKREEIEKND